MLVFVGVRADDSPRPLCFSGLGVGCVGVGVHIARRVAVAHEDKMFTFVVCEIA